MGGGILYMGLNNVTTSEDLRRQKKRTPQDEVADARYRDAMALRRAEMAQQVRQFDATLAARQQEGQQAGIRGIAAGGGSMSGAAGKYLLEQAAGQGGGETYADRLARVNATYADKVRRSNAEMAKGQIVQNRMDEQRMAASPVDTRRMTWQTPGGDVRELRGQDTQLSDPRGRTAEAYSQMVGTQAELAQKYPDKQPGLNIVGMAAYQQAMRGEAFGPQGDNQAAGQHGQAAPSGFRRELSPQEYSQVEQSFAANAPVRMPYTEGPGTVQGRSAPISQGQDRENVRIQQLNIVPGGQAWSEQIRNMEKNLAAAKPQFKEQWQKDKDKLANDFMKKVPDPDDRAAIAKLMGFDKSWVGSMAGSDDRLSAAAEQQPGTMPSRMPVGPTTGPDANTMVLPVSRFNEGMAARTIDAGAPMTRQEAWQQEQKQMAERNRAAEARLGPDQQWLAANPAPTPGSRFQEDPTWAKQQAADLAAKEAATGTELAKGSLYRSQVAQGPQPTEAEVAASQKAGEVLGQEDFSPTFSESWTDWARRTEGAAQRTVATLGNIKNDTVRRQRAVEIMTSPQWPKLQAMADRGGMTDSELKNTYAGPAWLGRPGQHSGLMTMGDVAPSARKAIAAAKQIIEVVTAAAAPTRQPAAAPVATR